MEPDMSQAVTTPLVAQPFRPLATQVAGSNQIINVAAGVFAALALAALVAGSAFCATGVGALVGAPVLLIGGICAVAAGYLMFHTNKTAQTPEEQLPSQLTKSAQIMNLVAGVFAAMGAATILGGFACCATGVGVPIGVPVVLIGSVFEAAAGYIAYQARQLKA